jgi:alpha-amylase/alpha-mannosidase (GH57 family)
VYWSNFLHIYQPPTQTEEIVRKVSMESYRTIVRVLKEYPGGKVTFNINGVLTEQLIRYDFNDIIKDLQKIAERGQIEFTGSAIYHPILPLIPKEEVIRQIELNTQINRKYFGDIYNPKGFFPPEMCYSYEVAQIAAELGFKWILIDEISFNGKIGSVSYDRLYRIQGLDNFLVFFKDRPFSAGITYGMYPSAKPFLDAVKDRLDKHTYLLSGTDGEVYGHHRRGQEKLLIEVFNHRYLKTCTISELINLFKQQDTVNPLPSSWSTWEDEMAQGIPYPQWQYPGNRLHKLQWQLLYEVINIFKKVPDDIPGFNEARQSLDRGLHSCQFWWASCRPWWSVEMIEWGAQELYQAVQLVKDILDDGQKRKIERLYQSVVNTAKRWQDTGKALHLKNKYKKEHPEVSTELTFGN